MYMVRQKLPNGSSGDWLWSPVLTASISLDAMTRIAQTIADETGRTVGIWDKLLLDTADPVLVLSKRYSVSKR